MMKKWICVMLSLLCFLGALPTSSFAAYTGERTDGAATEPKQEITAASSEEDFRLWKTDIRLSIQQEKQLMQEAEMTLDAWDREVSQRKHEGLQNPLTGAALREADPDTEVLSEDGRVYYIGPSEAFAPVEDALAAYELVYRLADLIGASEQTDLRLWSKLGINGLTVYSFQEVADSETVLGSTVKIALDDHNRVSAVFANLIQDDTDGKGEDAGLVSRGVAEQAALAHGKSEELYAELTERTIRYPADMAKALDLESDDDDPVPQQLLWVVYTSNSSGDPDFPYLAHYVKLDGTWLFSLPVKKPGDDASLSGYEKPDVFGGMTADEYTGEITSINGDTRMVTVPVMYCEEDGMWYLGDLDRRIAVADFYEAAYLNNHPLNLVKSETNSGWDNEDLYMYYNYIRAWDFYADMGWIGPDGQGSDVIILKGLAYRSHDVYQNAASCGKVENWQMFAYAPYNNDGSVLGLVQGLDVMAHEYTHTFTATVMNENLYENDLGAINEAMSDIMGNLVEYICGDTENTKWELGENTGVIIRSMSNPTARHQPAFVWDMYYGPHTDNPGIANDRGGVHSNSSLLNRIAALLCLEHGMSYEEAVSFWLTVAMGMTPETDYRQMGALLNWAAVQSGNEAYLDALNAMIEEERLAEVEPLETYPEGQELVILRLPETEAFAEDNWIFLAYQLDTKSVRALSAAFVKAIMKSSDNPDDPSVWKESLQEIAEHAHLNGTEVQLEDVNSGNEFANAVVQILKDSDLFRQLASWEENGTGEIPMVEAEDNQTLYLLLNISAGGSMINGLAIMIGGQWIDLLNLQQGDVKQIIARIGMSAAMQTGSGDIEGSIRFLPTAGLEDIQLSETGFNLASIG